MFHFVKSVCTRYKRLKKFLCRRKTWFERPNQSSGSGAACHVHIRSGFHQHLTGDRLRLACRNHATYLRFWHLDGLFEDDPPDRLVARRCRQRPSVRPVLARVVCKHRTTQLRELCCVQTECIQTELTPCKTFSHFLWKFWSDHGRCGQFCWTPCLTAKLHFKSWQAMVTLRCHEVCRSKQKIIEAKTLVWLMVRGLSWPWFARICGCKSTPNAGDNRLTGQ